MNYGKQALVKKMTPHTGRKIFRKLVSTLLKLALLALLTAVIGAGIYASRVVSSVIAEAPDLSTAALAPSGSATYIYNQSGERIQKLTLPEANRDIVSLASVPQDLQHAVVAIEDERFYEHKGIDPKGIVRAFIRGISKGSFSEGASTITQQLLKNSVFPGWTRESSFQERLTRKIQEQYLALKLEKIMTKNQILENYLNMINLGAGCYGVQAASYRYFGKNVSDLTLSEAAVIAGITQNPTAYNPIVYPEKNAARRKLVLNAMLEQNYIDEARYQEALADDVYSRIQNNQQSVDTSSSVYTYYQDALIDQVLQDLQNEKGYSWQQAYLAVYSGGLRIYSAQDDAIQAVCDKAFADPSNFPDGTEVGIDYALSVQDAAGQITDYGNDDLRAWIRRTSDPSFDLMYQTTEEARASAQAFREATVAEGDKVLGERVTVTPQPQASCVIIDQANGLVKALVGGRGTKDASLTLNRASYTTRQPGSTFKILTAYAPALNEGDKTLISTYVDEPYEYQGGTPVRNSNQSYLGEITIRDAIVQSVNVVAVKCLTELGPHVGFKYAQHFGISSLVESYDNGSETLTDITQTLALGGLTRGVTNLDLTAAYACIASLGHYTAPKFYTEVLDQYGNVVLDNTDPKSRTVIRESTAALLTAAMRGVIEDEKGTAHGYIDLGLMPAAGKSGTTSGYKDSWFVGYTPYYTCGIWGGYDNNAVLPDSGIYHSYSKILWNSIMNGIHKDLQITAFHTAQDVVQVNLCRETLMCASDRCPDTYVESFAAGTEPPYYCSVHGNGGLAVEGSISGAEGGSAFLINNEDSAYIPPDPNGSDYRVDSGNGTSAGTPGSGTAPVSGFNAENGTSAPEYHAGNGTQPAGPDPSGGSSYPEQQQPVPAPSQGGGGITVYSSDQTVLNPGQDNTAGVSQSPQGTWYLEEPQGQEADISQNAGQSQNQASDQSQAVIEILNNIPPAQP